MMSKSVVVQWGIEGSAKFSIPLLPTALAILEKYEEHPMVVNGECVLPVLSNKKSNANLKELADLCGIKKNLNTHVTRNTFAATLNFSNDLPNETVGKMRGSIIMRTERHYAKIFIEKEF
ncbi:hypothetical protein N9954_06820 [Maribacter sp.]|nr:hypothetical protein [Maribacter sp.]